MLFDSDERLIAKALNGHETAWVKLVKRYEKRIYNHCLRMTGATDEAMDIVQEVFISVFRNLPNYRGDGVFPAWIFRGQGRNGVRVGPLSLNGRAFLATARHRRGRLPVNGASSNPAPSLPCWRPRRSP